MHRMEGLQGSNEQNGDGGLKKTGEEIAQELDARRLGGDRKQCCKPKQEW